jgi:hypothetical protein
MLYVGRRIRASERGQAPLSRPRDRAPREHSGRREAEGDSEGDETVVRPVDEKDDLGSRSEQTGRDATVATVPVPSRAGPARGAKPRPASSGERSRPRARPRFPPPPPGSPEQMSFEDSPPQED